MNLSLSYLVTCQKKWTKFPQYPTFTHTDKRMVKGFEVFAVLMERE